MRRTPLLLAIGFILITFFRVSTFLFSGMKLGWLGYSFALALTAGVYVTAYYTKFNETKWVAFVSLVLFGAADLLFNEAEMVRTLSVEQMIIPTASFLGLSSQAITNILHFFGLVYGALPTLFAGMLGMLQSRAEKVASLKVVGFWTKLWRAIAATFMKGLNASLQQAFGKENFAAIQSGNLGKSLPVAEDAVMDAPKIRWEDLLAQDKEAIAHMSPRQIMGKYGNISVRTARNWKQWVNEGK